MTSPWIRQIVGALVCLIIPAAMASAQSGNPVSTAEAEAVAADNAFAHAVATCDTKLMDRLLSDELMFVHNNSNIGSKAEYVKQVSTCFLDEARSDQIKVRVYGSDVAVITGKYTYRSKGAASTGQIVYTRLWVRQSGAWRLVTHQSTPVPARP